MAPLGDDPDADTLLTTHTYGSYDEAAEDANQVDDILVLLLAFEELTHSPLLRRDTVMTRPYSLTAKARLLLFPWHPGPHGKRPLG